MSEVTFRVKGDSCVAALEQVYQIVSGVGHGTRAHQGGVDEGMWYLTPELSSGTFEAEALVFGVLTIPKNLVGKPPVLGLDRFHDLIVFHGLCVVL